MNILLITSAALGAVVTYVLQKNFGMSAVISSSIVGLVGGIIGLFIPNKLFAPIVFCGTFVGMSSPSLFSLSFVVIAGILSGVLYQVSTNIFVGFGGKLGSIAFLAVALVFYIKGILVKYFLKKV